MKNPERIKEIGKDYQPVLIISSNERNEYDNSVVALPLTTDNLENILPVEVFIKNTNEKRIVKVDLANENYLKNLDFDFLQKTELLLLSAELLVDKQRGREGRIWEPVGSFPNWS